MKTVKHAAKKAAKKTSSKYGCSVCGTVIEMDPCGCDSAAALVCCGKKMTKKR